jgi:hypothetical protein
MQFYRVHEVPTISAQLSPDYAIKRVNLREGWQMISDIGHIHGVTWQGQNKEYNAFHAKTRTYWQTKDRFKMFCEHYAACLLEYEKRFGKKVSFHDRYSLFMTDGYKKILLNIVDRNEYEMDAYYMLIKKNKYLTVSEIENLVSRSKCNKA